MAEPNSKPRPPKAQENPTGPLSNFLYKAIFVFVLIALLPLFPSSQSSPELENKTILSRSWELLHLLFVGIAISYGLFSRKNSEPDLEKELYLKVTDTQQYSQSSSYVSQILQVSSVFDEEFETPKVMDFLDEAKNQTWNNYSQYYREKPVVMVADQEESSSRMKPLFLPVRSLKLDSSHQTDKERDEFVRNKNVSKEGTVLPSPIPWRSRSGRMQQVVNAPPNSASSVDTETRTAPPPPPPPPQIPSFRSSTPHSTSSTPSPKRLSPSSSFSSEMREDLGRKKSFSSKSSPPPPPPLPPKHYASHFSMEKRDTMKSFKDELEGLSRRGKGGVVHGDDGLSSSGSFKSDKSSYNIGRSVRTVGTREAQSLPPLSRNLQSGKNNGFVDKISIVSNSDSDDDSEISDVEEESNQAPPPEENEVDKKADEFIAKFREQIRLQRIDSIKKSSGQRPKRNLI